MNHICRIKPGDLGPHLKSGSDPSIVYSFYIILKKNESIIKYKIYKTCFNCMFNENDGIIYMIVFFGFLLTEETSIKDESLH